jgi:hypothetical protein
MKARRNVAYQELVMEVLNQLKSRFHPNDDDIRRCVDQLIMKEFLDRLEDQSIKYLA